MYKFKILIKFYENYINNKELIKEILKILESQHIRDEPNLILDDNTKYYG